MVPKSLIWDLSTHDITIALPELTADEMKCNQRSAFILLWNLYPTLASTLDSSCYSELKVFAANDIENWYRIQKIHIGIFTLVFLCWTLRIVMRRNVEEEGHWLGLYLAFNILQKGFPGIKSVLFPIQFTLNLTEVYFLFDFLPNTSSRQHLNCLVGTIFKFKQALLSCYFFPYLNASLQSATESIQIHF